MPAVPKFLFSIVLLLFSLNTTAQWYPISVPPDTYFSGLAVLNEDTVLISEYDTWIFKTYDGGQTWIIDSIMDKTDWSDCGAPYPWDLFDIAVNGKHLITGGHDGVVFISGDLGLTWSCQKDVFADFVTFLYASESKVFAFNSGFSFPGNEHFVSDDSGKTWQPKHTPPLINAAFINDSFGIGCGRGVYTTYDLGDSWSATEADTNKVYYDIWSDGENVVAVGKNGYLTRSVDSGKSWSNPVKIHPFDVYAVDFFTARIGVAVSVDTHFDESYILGTEDSGQTWIALDTIDAILRRVEIANDSVGYIVGWPEAVYKTTNAGGLPLLTHAPDKLRPDIEASIFPNPFRNQVVLDISTHSDKVTLFVSDARGRIVFTKTVLAGRVSIDLKHLPQGIYALSIIGGNSRKDLRLIKME